VALLEAGILVRRGGLRQTRSSYHGRFNDLSRLKAEFQVPERYITKSAKHAFAVKSTTTDDETATQGDVYFRSSIIDRNTRFERKVKAI